MELLYQHLEAYLHSRVRTAEDRLQILTPFVRAPALRRLRQQVAPEVSITIVMRWDLHAFATGASDPDVYPLCTAQGIKLLAHPTIHLKMFLLDGKELIAGSANLTDRALGVAHVPNVEFMTHGVTARRSDLDLVRRLEEESRTVQHEDYLRAVAAAERAPNRPSPAPPSGSTAADPLLAQIPATLTVAALWKMYCLAPRDRRDTAHNDLSRFGVPPGLDEPAFLTVVRRGFLGSPLLRALTSQLRTEELYFGALKRWLLKTCADADGFGAREVTPFADRLLNWIEGLGEPRYSVIRPNYSELLRYETDLDELPLLRAPGVRPTRPEDRN